MDNQVRLPLTPVQQKVYDLDQQQIRPTKIAELTGLRVSRVANVKNQLKRLGYSVTVWHVYGNPKPVKPASGSSKTRHVRQFCKCGLTLPCNSCLDEIQFDRGSGGLAMWDRGHSLSRAHAK